MKNENTYKDSCKPTVVAVVGTGNVASHLVKALQGKVTIIQVNPHTFESMPDYADIVIISVKDSVIQHVAHNLPGQHGIIAHTSGSVPMSALAGCEASGYGVFYPLQTFTKGVDLDYSEIPFFIEGDSETTVSALTDLARLISDNVREADSEGRKMLHLASVFACNFSNCLVGIADKLLRECGMDYTVLLPLLKQTVKKLDSLTPAEAQTGPAARLDMGVVNRHIDMLNDMGERRLAEIYGDMSDEIIMVTHPNP